jgi:hypothetical protein
MDTNSEKLLLKREVFQVVGCTIEVLNTLGHGLVEKPYEHDKITDHEPGLMLNYLRITSLRAGVILNFKHRKLEWERIAL